MSDSAAKATQRYRDELLILSRCPETEEDGRPCETCRAALDAAVLALMVGFAQDTHRRLLSEIAERPYLFLDYAGLTQLAQARLVD